MRGDGSLSLVSVSGLLSEPVAPEGFSRVLGGGLLGLTPRAPIYTAGHLTTSGVRPLAHNAQENIGIDV
jgi:hypothetical protein